MGKIRLWNDSAIIADNKETNAAVANIMRKCGETIRTVVRTDSSGTSEIFTTALSLFNPTGASSFSTVVGKGPVPNWCGPSTDEVQVMTVTGCAATAVSKTITLKIIARNSTAMTGRTVRTIAFNCDASAADLASVISSGVGAMGGTGLAVTVSKTGTNFTIGYSDNSTVGVNWYRPVVGTAPDGVAVGITVLQEGGFLNVHFNSTYTVTPIVQSLWVKPTALGGTPMSFQLSFRVGSGTSVYQTAPINANANADLTQLILDAVNALQVGAIAAKSSILRTDRGGWDEYQITFAKSTYTSFATSCPTNPDNVVVFSLLDYNNYPLFYDSSRPLGSGGSGQYTCYLRHLNYVPWTYSTGRTNPGIIADVFTLEYSIGYSVLTDAMNSYLKMADLINKAGVVIAPSSYSVASAIMDKGGNLNDRMEATLADSSSVNAWPIAGLTYFVIRKNHHIGSCDRRKAAMTYLYKYYYSTTVKQIALRLGYATLPDFIRDTVVTKLIDTGTWHE